MEFVRFASRSAPKIIRLMMAWWLSRSCSSLCFVGLGLTVPDHDREGHVLRPGLMLVR
jgi:hypothetical protein